MVRSLKASFETTCSEAGAGVGFPNLAGGLREAEALLWGQVGPVTFEQVWVEKAAEEMQPEASEVPEGQQDLSVSPRACFGFQESVFRQMPEPGSEGH